MEDEYAQFKKSLLRDANCPGGEEAMGSDSPVMGPEIESVEQRLAKTHPKPQRQRSSDNLKSIFGGTSSTSSKGGDDLVGPDLVAFSRRIGEDEPFPGAILSPEMEAAAEGSLKPPELGGRERRPSSGEVYTIQEMPEEETSSPIAGDLVSRKADGVSKTKEERGGGKGFWKVRENNVEKNHKELFLLYV